METSGCLAAILVLFAVPTGGWQSYLRDDAAGTAVLTRLPKSRAVRESDIEELCMVDTIPVWQYMLGSNGPMIDTVRGAR